MAELKNKKSKKSQTDLDKELDAYMLVAKSKATATLKSEEIKSSNNAVGMNTTSSKDVDMDGDVVMDEV